MSRIRLNEALKIMQNGEMFSVKYVSYDKNRKTGGKLIEYPEVKLNQKKESQEIIKPKQQKKLKKNPNHWDNSTRSLKIFVNGLDSGMIRKIHIFLMLEFNGQKVFL